MRFIHTADIHLGKTYRHGSCETARFDDFFLCLDGIVADAVSEQVDFMLIAGDLFHTGQILPRTFARTIDSLQPLKQAGIPCIAVEGNHDWIHRRDSISWMEALSAMGYIRLLRPERTADGGYFFAPYDEENGLGGVLKVGDLHIYGLGYIGAQAGGHVQRICRAVTTQRNLLLFHVGIWKYSPVEIGNMKLEEAHPLAEMFDYVALGHGHKPYVIEHPKGKSYAFNPGAPERVNFGEERYEKGYYLVTEEAGNYSVRFRPTRPRPMRNLTIDLNGCETVDMAMERFREEISAKMLSKKDEGRPLMDVKLVGRVGFHPFEMGRERLRLVLDELIDPLHVEVRNLLSMVTRGGEEENRNKSLFEIEKDVLRELIGTGGDYRGREEELTRLALTMRDLVLKGAGEGDELLDLLDGEC
jgi:exonuclease SbcD